MGSEDDTPPEAGSGCWPRSGSAPDVSFVVPAKNEGGYLGGTLSSIAALDTDTDYEVLVVDGASTDRTREIALEFGASVIPQDSGGIGAARHQGATAADGRWLAFVDADTKLRQRYLETMIGFLEREGLAAGSSYCRITGPLRAKLMELTINHAFSRLERPILPGFNFVVHSSAYWEAGGFPDVPNEDTAFSRRLAREFPTGYCRQVLVESSGRRIAETGLTGTLWHYGRLDYRRLRSEYR